ncbi:MAG: lipoyl(octanoyl) transferase LipB [Cytophagaceae bacterium]|nr:lipoyl(octanoyl) transferase LipB [Gemmatimonadaceae bacterium]
MNSLYVVDLDTMRYADALELQRHVAKERISGKIPEDVLLLVEHPHVVTLGRSTRLVNLVASKEQLEARGIELFDVERGGDVTYHGPGQLVGYPIIDLKRHKQDLHWYLRQVEEALIVALRTFGIEGVRQPGYTGVWVETTSPRIPNPQAPIPEPTPVASRRKLASIGVHARDWVTWHGFALNVTTDLSYFDVMVPCGIADVTMTSIQREATLGAPGATIPETKRLVAEAFARVFRLEPQAHTLD